MFYTYIIECRDGSYYTGYTNDLKRRVKQHNGELKGSAKYTRGKRPVRVVWYREYRYLKSAVKTEYKIKKLTRRQKELLVEGVRLDNIIRSGRLNLR
ncbi:MAG: GIY-YIG nuclease family protein [Candidatus Omnitrophota bacterium]